MKSFLKYKKEDEFRYTNDKLTNEWHSQIAFWRRPAPSSKMAKALQKIIIMSKDPNQTTITGSYYEDNGDPVKFFTEYRNTEIKLQNIFNELKATQTDKEALQKPSLILRPENFCLLHKLNFCANDCSGYF